MSTKSHPRKSLFVGLALYGIAIALLPYVLRNVIGLSIDPSTTIYPWNYSPLMAMTLFGAAYMKNWRLALLIPLSVKVVTDVGIGLLMGDLSFALYSNQPVVYGCYALCVGLGLLLRDNQSALRTGGRGLAALRIGGTGLAAELIFFLVTNFGAWLQFNTFPHTPAGLVACYVAAIPFFGRSLLGTFVYSGALFGGYAWLQNRVPAREPQLAGQYVE